MSTSVPEPPTSMGTCLPTPLWRGSLPVAAAQLPAVLILAALRIIHLMDTETFLEVLGANLGVQDLFSHGTGEPASLLVVQSLTEDPPYARQGWGSGLPSGHREAPFCL